MFDAYPEDAQQALINLRQLIRDVADEDPEIGRLTETTKWGEPAFLTEQTRSGTTIRIDWKRKTPELYYLFVSCQTSLIDDARRLFHKELLTEGNRALVFRLDESIPTESVRSFVHRALRYKLDQRRPKRET